MSHTWLLAALLFLLFVEPFLSDESSRRWVFHVMVSAVLVAAGWTDARGRRSLLVCLLLALPALAAEWWFFAAPSRPLAALSVSLALAFLVVTVIIALRRVLTSLRVSRDTIAAAVCVYLLLAVIWAMAFSLIELARPGSFQFGGRLLATSRSMEGPMVSEFLYLSLITLTTVGYGDVLPMTAVARRIAALEAVVGQLYLAILIARLVSLRAPDQPPSAPVGAAVEGR